MCRQNDADDGADGVGGVDHTYGFFAMPCFEQCCADQRQCHAGTEGCGEHDRQCNAVACKQKQTVAGVGFSKGLYHLAHEPKHFAVERQRCESKQAHRHLNNAKVTLNIADPVDAALDPNTARGDA